MKSRTKEKLETITPSKALNYLKEGNERFVKNLKFNRDLKAQVDNYRDSQYPFAIVLSCMDSRTTTEHIFDQGLGDVFVLRVAGNVINDDMIGSMEYACGVVGSKLIMVLGHSKCGAVKGACADVELGKLTQLLAKLDDSVANVESKMPTVAKTDAAFVEAVAHHNVLSSLDDILSKSELLSDLYNKGTIGLAGAYYDIETGKVEFMKEMLPA